MADTTKPKRPMALNVLYVVLILACVGAAVYITWFMPHKPAANPPESMELAAPTNLPHPAHTPPATEPATMP